MIEEHFKNNRETYLKRIAKRAECVENAEDIIQNTYLMALQYWDSYDHSKPLDNWVNTILTNELRKFMRAERNKGMSIKDEGTAELAEDPKVLAEFLREKYNKEKKAEVLNLFFVKGYKPKEISLLLGQSYWAVNKTIERFRKFLEKVYDTESQQSSSALPEQNASGTSP